jgi:hypothetical protein
MTTIQMLELLSKIQTALHNAEDEVDDMIHNEEGKKQALHYLEEVEFGLFHVIDSLEERALTEGARSGAV